MIVILKATKIAAWIAVHNPKTLRILILHLNLVVTIIASNLSLTIKITKFNLPNKAYVKKRKKL